MSVGTYSASITISAEGATNSPQTPQTIPVTLTISPNNAPVANADTKSTAEDTALIFSASELTANDTDPDGDSLTVTAVAATANTHGTMTLTGSIVTHTPEANFNGLASFAYTISDGNGGTATATVTVTVTPVNDAPTANGQSVTTAEDTSVAITLTGNDVDGDPLIFSIATPPANGTLSGTPPNLTYTPNANFNGSDSFTFTVSDGLLTSVPATVSITVTPANDAPVLASIGNKTVNEGELLQFTITATDPDGNAPTYSASNLPAGASFDALTGTFSYMPGFEVSTSAANSFFDVFFEVSDGLGGTDSETVRITVIDVAGGTPTGTNVAVQPVGTTTGTTPVTLTFSSVDQGGVTSLSTSGTGAPPPSGFKLGNPSTYYELTTTAVFSGSVTVCINYSGISFKGKEKNLKLFHFEGGVWTDRTISLDTTNKMICASVTSLSPFAIFEPATLPFAAFDGKVEIELGPLVNDDTFEVKATFTLGADSNGIDPLNEEVSFQVGTFSTTVPAGSFKQDKKGRFKFEGVIDGVALEAVIQPLGGGSFEFKAEGEGADLTGTANLVELGLTIGDDGDNARVTAEFEGEEDD